MLNEPPYRLCCGKQHWGVVCPDGKVMCQLCYERFEKDQLHRLDDGCLEDVCRDCARSEEMTMRIRAI